MDAAGTVRKEIKEFQSQDDTADYREYRFSYDNGKTWTEWVREPLPAREKVGSDEIDENLGYQKAQHVYNPVVGHFVSLQCQFIYIDGYAATEAHYWAGYTRPMHSFLMIENREYYAEVLKNIKIMCKDEMSQKELIKLRKTSLPLQQKILLFCVTNKWSGLAMEIAYIRAKIKL